MLRGLIFEPTKDGAASMWLSALERFLKSALAQRFLRFAVVGAVSTAAHYTVLIALRELAHLPLLPATSTGYLVGSVVAYTLNRRYTFEANNAFADGLVKYIAVGIVGFALNGAITTGLTALGLFYVLSQMIATGLVLIWNFCAAQFFVFRK